VLRVKLWQAGLGMVSALLGVFSGMWILKGPPCFDQHRVEIPAVTSVVPVMIRHHDGSISTYQVPVTIPAHVDTVCR
jgi:hypothetical protein